MYTILSLLLYSFRPYSFQQALRDMWWRPPPTIYRIKALLARDTTMTEATAAGGEPDLTSMKKQTFVLGAVISMAGISLRIHASAGTGDDVPGYRDLFEG